MNKDEIIKDLSEKLEMERQVKKHEVLINASYKETITRLEDQLKFVLKTKKYVAHDEKNDCKVGDTVRIMETRPLSASKCWRLVEIIERAK